MVWPDIVVGFLLLFGAFHGWRVGLIRELTGMLAFFVAVVAGFVYPGFFDGFVREHTSLGPGSAHVLALFVFSAAAYFVVSTIGFVLGRIAKLPVIGFVNGALGAAFGFAKIAIVVWAVLYVALFFPLSPDLRSDLHKSRIVAIFAGGNAALDGSLQSRLPWFAQPYSDSIFERHKV